MMFACRFWNWCIYWCWLFQKVQIIWMIFRSHTLQIRFKVSNGSQLHGSEWFNRLSDSMFASFPLVPWRTSVYFLHDSAQAMRAKVSCKAIDCILRRPFPYETACGTRVHGMGGQLCQPFLRMHSLRLPPKTRRHWWKKQHLSHGPRGTGQRCFGGLASGWQVPLVFLKAKRDGRMEEDGPLFGFLSRRKLYCIPPFCYPSPSGLLVCWHFQLWGCSPASLAIVPLCSHSGV